MSESTVAYELLKEIADFCLVIGWSGDEDKPYPRARLRSRSWAEQVEEDPFWGDVVIDPSEYRRLIDLFAAEEVAFSPDSYTGGGNGYYVEIQTGEPPAVEDLEAAYHTFLGATQQTLSLLVRMVERLEPEHRDPVQQIVARLGGLLGNTSA